jgi:hypothetical protein
MADNVIVLSSGSSSDSNDSELLSSFARRFPKLLPPIDFNLVPSMFSVANPDYCESAHLWFYPLYSRKVESGESITQNVSRSLDTLNPKPSALHLASAHLPDECSSETRISVEQDSDCPKDLLADDESLSSSMSDSLNSEFDPAYSPSSCSQTSPGSDSSLTCHVDMEPAQE